MYTNNEPRIFAFVSITKWNKDKNGKWKKRKHDAIVELYEPNITTGVHKWVWHKIIQHDTTIWTSPSEIPSKSELVRYAYSRGIIRDLGITTNIHTHTYIIYIHIHNDPHRNYGHSYRF